MSLVEWLPLALVCFLGAATPGPSLAIIINHTVKSGKKTGQLASVSHAIAVGLYALLAVLGLAAVFKLFPIVATVFVYLGAGYLAYLGIKILRAKVDPETNQNKASTEQSAINWSGVKEAFLIAFLNPKLAVFFLALFSQFIPATGAGIELTVILVGTVLLIDMLWYLGVVESVSRLQRKLTIGQGKVQAIVKAQGILFILLAINAVIFSS